MQNNPPYDAERLARVSEACVVFRAWHKRLRRTYRHNDIAATVANQKTLHRTGIDIHEELVLPYLFQAEVLAQALENQH